MTLIGKLIRNFQTTEAGELLGYTDSGQKLRVRFNGAITTVLPCRVSTKGFQIWLDAPDDFGGTPLGEKPKRVSKPRVAKGSKVKAVLAELMISRGELERRCAAAGMSVVDFCRRDVA